MQERLLKAALDCLREIARGTPKTFGMTDADYAAKCLELFPDPLPTRTIYRATYEGSEIKLAPLTTYAHIPRNPNGLE